MHKTLGLQEKFIPAAQMFVMLLIFCSTKTSLSIFRPFSPISDNFWTSIQICEILFCDIIVQNFIAKTILFTESKNVKAFSSYEHFSEARCYIFHLRFLKIGGTTADIAIDYL